MVIPEESNSTETSKPAETSSEIVPVWRHQALEYPQLITTISLDEFQRVAERLDQDFFTPWKNPAEELISRACSLIFHLQTAGGLLTARPLAVLEKTKIEKEAVLNGFFRFVTGKKKVSRQARHFMYAAGRIQLKSFVVYRLSRNSLFQAKEGDYILPKLTREIVKEASAGYRWLRKLNRIGVTWSSVYNSWVNEQFGGQDRKILLRDFVENALWLLYRREPPFIFYLRRNRFPQMFLPDSQIYRYFSDLDISNTFRSGDTAIGNAANGENPSSTEQTSNSTLSRTNVFDQAANLIDGWLASLKNKPETIRKSAAASARELLKNPLFNYPETVDLRNALEWTIHRMTNYRTDRDRYRRIGTTATNLGRLMYFLTEIPEESHSKTDTDTLSEFLENYATTSAKAHKSTVKQFDEWLGENHPENRSQINWKSSTLSIPDTYSDYSLINKQDFNRLLESVLNLPNGQTLYQLLIFLRCTGLRCAEAAALQTENFEALLTEASIKITSSKTKAGKRTLPLFHLLGEILTAEISQSIRVLLNKNQEFFFTDEDGNSFSAASIGRIVKAAMKKVGLGEHSAHSLRHSFANELLIILWQGVTPYIDSRNLKFASHPFSWVSENFEKEFRSGFVENFIVCLDDIRRLMGHATLSVTLSRYIHVTDMITADAIRIHEILDPNEKKISLKTTAFIFGVTESAIQKKFFPSQNSDSKISAVKRTSNSLQILHEKIESELNEKLKKLF